jgi:excisionase family DNA binding protein
MALRRKSPLEEQTQPRWLEVDASMTGTLSFKDPVNLQINGRFEGTLETKGNLSIGENAQVKATIFGELISIAGTVEGTLTASRRIELLGTGRVLGKVTTPKLMIHEGAILHGTCEMIQDRKDHSEPQPQSMTLEELARYLEVDTNTVLDWAQSGRLPAQREGTQWRFDRKRIEEWLAQEKLR